MDDQTNRGVTNDPQNDVAQADDDDAHLPLPLSLSLSQTSSPSPTATPPLRFSSPSPVSRGSSAPSLNFLPTLGYVPPSNQPPARAMTITITSAVESRGSFASQSNDETIPAPFPWATNKRCTIQSRENLEAKQITTITGDVQCRHCGKVYQVSYDLREKFSEVENFFVTSKKALRERAPLVWTNLEPVRCELCGRDKAVKPVIADRKRKINWLFLLLGQTLGYCTLEQLRNFCKHSNSPRTGAKDRVLYLTYLGLCKMLEPNRELFNRDSSSL